jgi:hypothetical protein
MKYMNKAHKAKADKLRKGAKADKAKGPGKAGGPSLRNAAKQIRERKKAVKNQVNSAL